MSEPNGPDPRKLAQEQLDRILAKTHDSLKWSWLVVMGYALYNATEETYKIMIGLLTAPSGADVSGARISILIAVLVFLPTFIRFFFGDNRYIDDQYSELRRYLRSTRRDAETSEAEILRRLASSRKRRGLDAINLLAHGIIFALLSLAISRPVVFFMLYASLLLVNCVFLFLNILNNTVVVTTNLRREPGGTEHDGQEETVTRTSRRDRTLRFWIKNNAGFLIVFVFALWVAHNFESVYSPWFLCGCIGLFFANSCVDLYFQLEFYLPRLDQIYKRAIDEARESPDASAPQAPAAQNGAAVAERRDPHPAPAMLPTTPRKA